MKKIIIALLFAAAIVAASGQTRLRIETGAGLYRLNMSASDDSSHSPVASVVAEYRIADLGTGGAIYAGLDLKYSQNVWRITTSDPSVDETCYDNLNVWALRAIYAFDVLHGAVQFYAGGTMGFMTDIKRSTRKDTNTRTNFDEFSLYGRAVLGVHVRLLPWVGLFCEAGAPLHQVTAGLSFDF